MSLLIGHRISPPMCETGDCRDGDKLLCNNHVFEILVVLLYAGFPMAVFSVGQVLVKHFTPLYLFRASCFRGHLLHSNLSLSLQFPVPHIGGIISWPVSSDMIWKHFHDIPLDMEFHSSEDNSLWKTIKISFLSLAWLLSVIPTPMGEILQRGRANWHYLSVVPAPGLIRSVF